MLREVNTHLDTTTVPHFTAPLGIRRHLPLFVFLPGLDGTGMYISSQLEGLKAHMANPTQVNIFTSSVGNEFVAAIIFCSIAPCYFVLQEQISDGSDDEFRPIPW